MEWDGHLVTSPREQAYLHWDKGQLRDCVGLRKLQASLWQWQRCRLFFYRSRQGIWRSGFRRALRPLCSGLRHTILEYSVEKLARTHAISTGELQDKRLRFLDIRCYETDFTMRGQGTQIQIWLWTDDFCGQAIQTQRLSWKASLMD